MTEGIMTKSQLDVAIEEAKTTLKANIDADIGKIAERVMKKYKIPE
jgi:hypothetical protein